MDLKQAKAKIEAAIQRVAKARQASAYALVPENLTVGKVYEAHVLSVVLERMRFAEGYDVYLVGGTEVALKSAPGPINAAYPHFELRKDGHPVADVWTDVEFTALSASLAAPALPTAAHYHELDIMIVPYGSTGRPPYHDVWLGVECKATTYEKALARQILGVRRELSLLHPPKQTNFRKWPRDTVPADPQSCLAVFSTDSDVLKYVKPGTAFGIDFFHERMP